MQKKQNDIGLVWFRNDLRVNDNTVLNTAIKQHNSVIACYCFDPRHYKTTAFGFKKTEKYRTQFLIETLKDLKQNLAALNIELFVFTETPETVIPDLIEDYNITSIYNQKEWTSEEVDVLENVKEALPDTVTIKDFYDQFLYHPEDVNISFSDIPKVFTVFRKKVEKYSRIRASQTPISAVKIESITTFQNWRIWGVTFFNHTHNRLFRLKEEKHLL